MILDNVIFITIGRREVKKAPTLGFLALFVGMFVLSTCPLWATREPGDVDGDGRFTLRDVVLNLRFALGVQQPTQEQIAAGDVSPWVGWGQPLGDGKIKLDDVQRMLAFLVGKLSSDEFRGITKASYVGAKVCSVCHQQTHKEWLGTSHVKALSTLIEYPQGDMSGNVVCLSCHTVGFGKPGGFVSLQTTPDLAGVQCESCHGPGSEHVARGGDKTKILTLPNILSASVCGRCHRGSHHPQIEEWENSAHSEMTPAPANYFRQNRNVEVCGPCHSGDYQVTTAVLGRPAPQGVELKFSQTCAVCHDPHQRTGNDPHPQPGRDHQLRLTTVSLEVEKPNLCGQCHRRRPEDTPQKVSRPPHHSPQFSFLLGEGGVVSTTEPIRSAHANVPGQCVHCHMFAKSFESEEKPAITGHLFRPDYQACAPCHDVTTAKTLVEGTQNNIKTELEALKARLDKWGNWEYQSNKGPQDQSGIPDAIKEARHNYYYVLNEGSYGVHNGKYARALIEYAHKRLDSLNIPR